MLGVLREERDDVEMVCSVCLQLFTVVSLLNAGEWVMLSSFVKLGCKAVHVSDKGSETLLSIFLY